MTGRIVIVIAVGALAAAACGLPFSGEDPVELEAFKDSNVRQYVPADVPRGYRLWYVQPIVDARANAIVGAETLYQDGDLGIVTVCATGSDDVARHHCGADTLGQEHVGIIDRGEQLTVTTACASQSCAGFKPSVWLSQFGSTPPTEIGTLVE